MGNIGFTHQTISNGVTQVSAGTMQSVFDALRKIVDKSFRTAGEELDANTVSGAGIGTYKTMADNADNYVLGGIYHDPGSLTNGPWTGTYASTIYVGNLGDADNCTQLAIAKNAPTSVKYMKMRVLAAGSWSEWHEIYTSGTYGSDGNVGQPPAPKPTTGTPAGGANRPGQVVGGSVTAGNVLYYSGLSNLTGRWQIHVINVVVATGVIDTANPPGMAVGSGSWFSIPAGDVGYYWAIRVE